MGLWRGGKVLKTFLFIKKIRVWYCSDVQVELGATEGRGHVMDDFFTKQNLPGQAVRALPARASVIGTIFFRATTYASGQGFGQVLINID